MTTPNEVHSQSPAEERCLYETRGVVHLSSTRWLLLFVGCVFPEFGGAVAVWKLYPFISVILLASGLATVAFIFVFLRKQPCTLRVYPHAIEITTSRAVQTISGYSVKQLVAVRSQLTGVQMYLRGEILFIEVKHPEAVIEKFPTV